jgi:LCP family protein required for cell wall assembly
MWALYYLLANLINLIIKKHHKFMILMLFTILFSLAFTISSYYINEVYSKLDNFGEKDKITYTTNLITLSKNKFSEKSKIGIIQNKKDIEGYILPQELIKNKKIKNELITYNDYYVMLNALFTGEIDAMFVSANYITIFQNEDEYSKLADDTKIVYELSKEMKNQDLELKSDKSLTEPFTILIMGVDSEKDGLNANAAFNGDTLMLITFNPNTLNATIFSIPRDTYVPIACRHNAENKINSSAAYGTKCVIDTIENLTDVKIDYYIKINFKGVVGLIDSLGGVDVTVGKDFCEQDSNRRFGEHEICLKKGYQHLNGEQALAFARHRHTLLRGDIDRTKNQQIVVEAIAKKMLKNISFSEFTNILDSISNNIATNIERDQILSFYDTLKQMLLNSLNGEDIVTIEKTYLEYYDLPIYTGGYYVSAIGYYSNSLEAIKDSMKENLGTKKTVMYKSFSYDINKDYEEKIIGKGLTGGNTIETLPDFTGYIISDVANWANEKEINIKYEYIDKSDSHYKSEYGSGYVSAQSVRSQTRLSNIKDLIIYVNK